MKILFIQISDIHCVDSDISNYIKFEKSVAALNTIGTIDAAMLIVSGDLADTATKSQYLVCKKLLGQYLSELGKALHCGKIITVIVPGNHDIELPKGCRTAADIGKWKLEDHLDEELRKQDAFFEYANYKGCFINNKICDVQSYKMCEKTVQLCLLNSSPFSTRGPEDKEFHFLPSSVRGSLSRKEETDIKISVMHHSYEWCEWNTKEMVKDAIASDDLSFFGHDHLSESLTVECGNGRAYNIIMGGRFDLDVTKNAAFNAVVFDTTDNTIHRFEFNWDLMEKVFYPTRFDPLPQKKHGYCPSEKYLSAILQDKQNICSSFSDYYVFPKLLVEGDFSPEELRADVDIEEIFKAVRKNGVVHISGGPGSGKSSLLRYLYNKSTEYGLFPLFIEQRDYRDSRIEKMLKDLFAEQYEIHSMHSFFAFLQSTETKRIVFIDDFDHIENARARENLLNNLIDSGWLVIYSTKERTTDIEEVVKERLQCKEISSLIICPFYKESRDSLVEKIGRIKGKDPETIEGIKMAFDYMVQSQTTLFSFTPLNTLIYIKFFMESWTGEKRISKSLSMVFETNLRTALLKACKKDAIANQYLLALEYFADHMYFELKADKLSISQYSELLTSYNAERRSSINEKNFLEACRSASILSQGPDSLDVRFFDHNTYAYFVAKSLSREFDNDHTNLEKLSWVIRHICFGINDIIIMFLSFIRSNTRIVMMVADKAEELMANCNEWDIAENNLPFLFQTVGISRTVPSVKEKQAAKKDIERAERERHEMIRFKGIFDYNDEDADKPQFIAQRAFKYIQIIGRALVDQYGALSYSDIERMLDVIYKVPQKVVYSVLIPIQMHYEKLVKRLFVFISDKAKKEKDSKEKVTEEKVRTLLSQAGTALALNILNDIAYIVSNDSTMTVLKDVPADSINYRIFELMMEENAGNTPAFVSRAITLRSDLASIPNATSLIAQIARKHILFNGNIDHKQIDRLVSGNVLSVNNKGLLLLEKGKMDTQ